MVNEGVDLAGQDVVLLLETYLSVCICVYIQA